MSNGVCVRGWGERNRADLRGGGERNPGTYNGVIKFLSSYFLKSLPPSINNDDPPYWHCIIKTTKWHELMLYISECANQMLYICQCKSLGVYTKQLLEYEGCGRIRSYL